MTSETTIAGERTLLTPDQAQNLRDLAKVIGKLGAALPMPYQLYVTLLEKTLEGVAMLGTNKEFSQLLFRIIESCAPGPGVVGSRPEKFTLSSGQHVVGLVDREKMVGEEERWMCSFRASTGALVAAGVGKSVDEAFESMKSAITATVVAALPKDNVVAMESAAGAARVEEVPVLVPAVLPDSA